MYIYIVIPRQTVSFYQNSSVWLGLFAGRSKPGSKPIQLYFRQCFRPLFHHAGPRWLREF